MKTTLEINSEAFLANGITVVAHADQKHFMTQQSTSFEKGLRMMIQGLETYCVAYANANGDKAGNDGYIGPQLSDIAISLRYLLSGQGRFDGATLDKTLGMIANAAELDFE